MVKTREDLTGKTFGRLVVVKQVEDYITPQGIHRQQWLCKCKCDLEKEIIVLGSNLKNGNTQSCGCLHKESMQKFNMLNKPKQNQYNLSGDYGIGWTTNTNREFYFDIDDFNLIKDYCWSEHFTHGNYSDLCTRSKKDGKLIKMTHLLGCYRYDHANRNPFDNRRTNLRPASVQENNYNNSLYHNNTSGICGVSWSKNSQKWRAYISINNKQISLGYFKHKDQAIENRLRAELKYFGKDFSPQRHLFNKYNIT